MRLEKRVHTNGARTEKPFPISTLEHEVVYWPDDSERKYICDRIQEKYGFPNCVSFVNGTILPLELKPSLYGEEYYCRKGFYGVHCQVICDDEL